MKTEAEIEEMQQEIASLKARLNSMIDKLFFSIKEVAELKAERQQYNQAVYSALCKELKPAK